MTNKSLQAGCLLYHCLFFVYCKHNTCHRNKIYIYIYIFQSCDFMPLSTGTGVQRCHLWESNPHRGDCLWLNAKLANHWATKDLSLDLRLITLFMFSCALASVKWRLSTIKVYIRLDIKIIIKGHLSWA